MNAGTALIAAMCAAAGALHMVLFAVSLEPVYAAIGAAFFTVASVAFALIRNDKES